MQEQIKLFILDTLAQLVTLDSQIVLLVTLIIVLLIVLDSFLLVSRRNKSKSGLNKHAIPISIDGSKVVNSRDYISKKQKISGRPDIVVIEDGFHIPVEHKPLAKKLRDRYLAQLLVYMRLIEEFEGKKPPYGYLILGKENKLVKIENSEKNQIWLQGLLDEMHAIIDGGKSKPAPHPVKCKRCDVKAHCSFVHPKAKETPKTLKIAN